MKFYSLIVFIAIFDIAATSQSPVASLSWPQSASIPSCSDVPLEYPMLNGQDILLNKKIKMSHEDQLVQKDNKCMEVIRVLFATEQHEKDMAWQTISYTVDPRNALSLNVFEINPNSGQVTIDAEELVVDPLDGHHYAFSSVDPSVTNATVFADGSTTKLQVYDVTTKAWHNSTIVVTEGWGEVAAAIDAPINMIVSPNPATDQLTVSGIPSTAEISCVNALGKVFPLKLRKNLEYDIESLIPGTYTIVAKLDGKVYSSLFVKI